MTCPKCHGDMRSYERNGVHVDQCVYSGGSQPPPPARQDDDRHQGGHNSHDSHDYRGKHDKKKRKNFLEELFD